MSKSAGDWNFAKEDAEQKAKGWPLRRRLESRIVKLAEATEVDLGRHIAQFPEIEAAMGLAGYDSFLLDGEAGAKAIVADDISLELIGGLSLPTGEKPLVATFKRTLQLGEQWAYHDACEVKPEFRGRGISLKLMDGCLKLYERLGLTEARVQASETGRWHWARVGFQFSPPSSGQKVRDWAAELCDALEVRATIEPTASATQLVALGGNRKISMADVAAAVPRKAEEARRSAAANGLDFEERIEFGRAMLLTGPEWDGRLGIREADRVLFEVALEDKEERLRREAK